MILDDGSGWLILDGAFMSKKGNAVRKTERPGFYPGHSDTFYMRTKFFFFSGPTHGPPSTGSYISL
jgi:hypothetical protein